MKKWNFAASINRWALCLAVVAAGAANAKTIELRDPEAEGRYGFMDALTFSQSFTDSADFSVDDPSPREVFVTSLDRSIYSFVVRIGGVSAALQQLESAAFRDLAATARGPTSFDELTGAREHALAHSSIASGFPGSPYRGSLQAAAVRETDVWVMLLVGLGVVLYQLRRKQRTLEQQPVAA
jgi:hypothetical protein